MNLIIGVWRHGHGSWEAIRDDPDLGLKEKLFLVEPKKGEKGDKAEKKLLPNSIHLQRRTDYLTHLLHQHTIGSNGNAEGSSSVGKAKPVARKPKAPKSKGEGSTPSTAKKAAADKPVKKIVSGTKRKVVSEEEDEDESSSDSGEDSVDEGACKEMMRPVKNELKRLQQSTTGMSKSEKAMLYMECLTKIGGEIAALEKKEVSEEARKKRRRHLCKFLPAFHRLFPTRTHAKYM